MTDPRIYRASSLGYSLENLVAPHLGYDPIPPPEWLKKKFDEGTAIEPLALDKLRTDGWDIQDSQPELNSVGDYQIEVELEVIPGVAIVRGHLDALGKRSSSNNGIRVVEVKSMNADNWKRFFDYGWKASVPLFEKYKWQASVYMLATGLPLMLVAWNKETEEIARTNITEPFYGISDIARRIAKAEKYITDGVIPEGCQEYPCAYFYLHGERVEPEKADGVLDGLLASWLEVDKNEKAYKREKDTLRAAIVEYVGEEGKAKVKGSQGVTVSVNWTEGKHVEYDTKPTWVTTISGPRKGQSVSKDE